jgi:hypothetical protein
MLQLTAQSRRVQVLLQFLREQANKRATFLEMLAYLNEQLPMLEQKKISRRTLESDLQFIREELGLTLKHVNISRKHSYQLMEVTGMHAELQENLESK